MDHDREPEAVGVREEQVREPEVDPEGVPVHDSVSVREAHAEGVIVMLVSVALRPVGLALWDPVRMI